MALFKKAAIDTVAEGLPYKELYDDGTVLTKDWGLMKCWFIQYPDCSLSPTYAEDVTSAVAQAYQKRNLGQKDLKVSYWFCVHRVPLRMSSDPNRTGEKNMIGGDLEIEHHRNELFADSSQSLVNLNYGCCKVAVKVTDNGIAPDSRRKANEAFAEFESAMRTAQSEIFPLVCMESDGSRPAPERSIMSFLKYNISMEYRNWKCPNTPLPRYRNTEGPKPVMEDFSEFLSTYTLDKGKPMKYGDYYVQMMTLNDFPSETYPGILSALLTLPFEFRWSTRWIPFNNRESQVRAKNLRNKFKSAQKGLSATLYEQSSGKESENVETQAVVDSQAVEEVLVNLAHGEIVGEMTSTVMVWDKDATDLRTKVQAVHEKLLSGEFDAIEETMYSNYTAWQSSMPGDSLAGRRRPLVTASNLSHIIPFTTLYHGAARNEYLGRITGELSGEDRTISWPHIIGRLATRELFYLNLNGPKDDIGHTFIVGSTGGGKSVFLGLMGSQWARYPDSRVILFDKDQSFRNIVQRTAGQIYIPGAEDSPLSFMPLSRIKTKPHEVIDWLILAIQASGTECDYSVLRQELKEVVEKWDEQPPTLARFVERLRGRYPESLGLSALQSILDNGILAHLFGGETDSFNNTSFGQKTMIEMNALMNMGPMAVYPALAFIFSRIDELFDTDPKPTLLVLDEAWLFLNHQVFRKKIKEWLKTLRKKRVFVVMAIQNINDIDDPEEFLTSCHTRIYLANPELKAEGSESIREAYKKIGVTESEMAIIGNARRKRDYFIQQHEGSALVDFCVDAYQLERIARDGK